MEPHPEIHIDITGERNSGSVATSQSIMADKWIGAFHSGENRYQRVEKRVEMRAIGRIKENWNANTIMVIIHAPGQRKCAAGAAFTSTGLFSQIVGI